MSFICRRKILPFIFVVLSIFKMSAQISQFPVRMEIERENAGTKSRLINLVVELQNEGSDIFNGSLHPILPEGYKALSGVQIPVNLQKGEKKYIPLRLMADAGARAGSSELKIQLLNQSQIVISEKSTLHRIEVDNNLSMVSLSPIIFRSSDTEAVEVKIRVSNSGNIPQSVILVCKFPDPDKGEFFVEQEAVIGVKKDSVFTFTQQPSKSLAGVSNFTVNISGFRNPEKDIFNTISINVQNIASSQRFQEPRYSSFTDPSKNEITTSYRRVGQNVDMYQLLGSVGFNLPSGYVVMKTNASLFSNQQLPVLTNTNIMLRQGNSEYSVGSVNKMFETTLSGRGAEYSHTFNNKKIELGFVDQNFNLIEKNAFLKNGYGFFTKGSLNYNNDQRNLSAAYVYRYDPFERGKHHILGTEGNYSFNKEWRFNGKINAGLSSYEEENLMKPSLALETNYKGVIGGYNLNGNYFYSSSYFPGNRRGSAQFQQNVSKNLGDYNVFLNYNYSNFSPKFYFFERSPISENTRLDVGTKFPSIGKNINLGILYQFQNEASNGYNNFFGNWLSEEIRSMNAHRLVESLTWSNSKIMQTAVVSLENGFVQYPMRSKADFQLKFNANYSFRKFNLNLSYQKGSYYLSEYAFSYGINDNMDYKKTSVSLFYNDLFLKKKLSVNTGISYVDDIVYGKAPSAFFNLKYNTKKFGAFFNSSWYNYSVGSLTNNILTLELGITVNLKKAALDPGKKGKIQIFTFYDTNNNNIYDPDEKPAHDFIVNINNVVFKTDAAGNALYKNVPFGDFELKQLIQQGWYYDEKEFELSRYTYPLAIPLHQNGTVTGKLSLDYNADTALDFEFKTSSIYFNILKDNQLVQRLSADEEGSFTSFLPTGNYSVVLDEASLPTNVYCEIRTRDISVKAGEMLKVPEYVLKVRQKKINKKTFTN